MSDARIKTYSKKQMADLYEVSVWILNKWTKPFSEAIGEYIGKCYTPNQVKIIFEKLGDPPETEYEQKSKTK